MCQDMIQCCLIWEFFTCGKASLQGNPDSAELFTETEYVVL